MKLDKKILNRDFLVKTIEGHIGKKIDVLLPKIKEMLDKRWVYMENKNVFYDNEVVALYPRFNEFDKIHRNSDTVDNLKNELKYFSMENNLEFDFLTLEEVKKSFKKQEIFPYKEGEGIKYKDGSTDDLSYKKNGMIYRHEIRSNSELDGGFYLLGIHRLNGENSRKLSDKEVLYLWLKNGLVPQNLGDLREIYFDVMNKTSEYGKYIKGLEPTEENVVDKKSEKRLTKKSDVEEYEYEIYNLEKVKEDILLGGLAICTDAIIKDLLEVDKLRADIDPYDTRMIHDPNRGHWDIFPSESMETFEAKMDEKIYARDPRLDIKHGGVIGIDFGTKSTVVVHQENNELTLPLRVGAGKFKEQAKGIHYENPTAIEFINLEKFMEAYREKIGRPLTHWEDVTVSHTAYNDLVEGSSQDFYSIVSEIKQWCGSKEQKLTIKDKQGILKEIPGFINLTSEDINPVELYAYYLGCYINNMHTGIYLDYFLSFPVTYEQAVRKKILESFKAGLKKSLPLGIQEDENIMKRFNVSHGANEPAAYAICALNEYGFDPEDEEKIYYSVFDFGGGTTDFDFGIYEEASERKYDYQITHFGAGGSRYLGGENLLKQMAFQLLIENQEVLRTNDITFTLAPECNKFQGSEILLSSSQEAHLNMKKIVESLRWFWEKSEESEAKIKEITAGGKIKIDVLFDKSGNPLTGIELNINLESLEKVIKQKIEDGVKNFFNCLERAFAEDIKNIDKINIFLAGNSSKSQYVKDTFAEYEKKYNEIYSRENMFEIFAPLGSEEAYEKQEERGLTVDKNNELHPRPTGKTGVAFGLINCKSGGKIKIINRDEKTNLNSEINFKYYVGYNRKKKLEVVLDRDDGYGKWKEFHEAESGDTVEIFYTTIPEASTGKLNILKTHRVREHLEFEGDSANIYIRAKAPNVIEYVVGTEEGIKEEKYLSNVIEIKLD